MTRWRQAFDRIGGPDAVSWPAFWVTLIAAATGHLTTGGPVNASIVTRLLVVLAAQIAAFVPLVILRFTLLRNPPKPRPWVAIAGFAVAAVTRGATLSALLLLIGATSEGLWVYRIIAALQTTGLLLFIVALVVSTLRAHTRSLERLVEVQADLAVAQEKLLAEVEDRNEAALVRVKQRLSEELAALDAVDGAASVAELQRLASEVVRPMSHELATSLPAPLPPSGVTDAHVTWQQVVGQLAQGNSLRPVQGAAFMASLTIVAGLGPLGFVGFQLMAFLALGIFVGSWCANRVLDLVLPRCTLIGGVIATLSAGIAVGFLTAASMTPMMSAYGLGEVMFLAGGIFVSCIVLLVALVNAVWRQQVESEREMLTHMKALKRAVVRLRQVQWFQGKALSRALHGPVQTTVTSAALRLDQALRAGEPTDALLSTIRSDINAVIGVLDYGVVVVTDIDEALARISGTWEGLCTVEASVEDTARLWLEGDPVLASTVNDVVTEAVSNAVRHGRASHVTVEIAAMDDLVSLSVVDNGDEKAVGSVVGLGTSVLEECSLDWSRTRAATGSVLRVTLPVEALAACQDA